MHWRAAPTACNEAAFEGPGVSAFSHGEGSRSGLFATFRRNKTAASESHPGLPPPGARAHCAGMQR